MKAQGRKWRADHQLRNGLKDFRAGQDRWHDGYRKRMK